MSWRGHIIHLLMTTAHVSVRVHSLNTQNNRRDIYIYTHIYVYIHDCKETQPVHTKGDQSWVFTGRTDVEAELRYFGHLMQRADSFEKDPDAGKD